MLTWTLPDHDLEAIWITDFRHAGLRGAELLAELLAQGLEDTHGGALGAPRRRFAIIGGVEAV